MELLNGQNSGPPNGCGRPHGEPELPLGVLMASLGGSVVRAHYCRKGFLQNPSNVCLNYKATVSAPGLSMNATKPRALGKNSAPTLPERARAFVQAIACFPATRSSSRAPQSQSPPPQATAHHRRTPKLARTPPRAHTADP